MAAQPTSRTPQAPPRRRPHGPWRLEIGDVDPPAVIAPAGGDARPSPAPSNGAPPLRSGRHPSPPARALRERTVMGVSTLPPRRMDSVPTGREPQSDWRLQVERRDPHLVVEHCHGRLRSRSRRRIRAQHVPRVAASSFLPSSPSERPKTNQASGRASAPGAWTEIARSKSSMASGLRTPPTGHPARLLRSARSLHPTARSRSGGARPRPEPRMGACRAAGAAPAGPPSQPVGVGVDRAGAIGVQQVGGDHLGQLLAVVGDVFLPRRCFAAARWRGRRSRFAIIS